MNPETWDGAEGMTPLLRRAFHNWQRVERRRGRRIDLCYTCGDAGRLALSFSPWSPWAALGFYPQPRAMASPPAGQRQRTLRALRWARRKRGPLQCPRPRGWRYWTHAKPTA